MPQSLQYGNQLMGQVRLWNETRTGYPRDRSVVALFEEIASVHASSIAVVCEGAELTYAELNARANRLADRLRDMDVGAGTLVGCCLERSIELIVALIAVLKAGAAYVPLDPGYPKERIDFILADTRPPVILVEKAFHSTILADYRGPSVFVDVNDLGSSDLGDAAPEGAQNPRSLAYIMYTSGSTGRPKGVMVENWAIVRLVRNTNFCRFGPDEVFLQFAPISFDASTLEIWGPLLKWRPIGGHAAAGDLPTGSRSRYSRTECDSPLAHGGPLPSHGRGEAGGSAAHSTASGWW